MSDDTPIVDEISNSETTSEKVIDDFRDITPEELVRLVNEQEQLEQQQIVSNYDIHNSPLFLHIQNISLDNYINSGLYRMISPNISMDVKENDVIVSKNLCLSGNIDFKLISVTNYSDFINHNIYINLLSKDMLMPTCSDCDFEYVAFNRSSERIIDGFMLDMYNKELSRGLLTYIPSINCGKKFYAYYIKLTDAYNNPYRVFVKCSNLKITTPIENILADSYKLRNQTDYLTENDLTLCKNTSTRLYNNIFSRMDLSRVNAIITTYIRDTIDPKYIFKFMKLSNELNLLTT